MTGIVFFWSFLAISSIFQDDFLTDQKRYSRVRTALTEKEHIIRQNLSEHDIVAESMHLAIIAYKDEGELEIWAKNSSQNQYRKVDGYAICSKSGRLGPKRKEGDYQVPEGFYHINRFNPASNFYLSLGINYPNKADRIKSAANNPGGDIFIHGNCVTVGCLPMTDNYIKEIYLYSLFARTGGQLQIPVYIFPFKMNFENFKSFQTKYGADPQLLEFWKNLKEGHDLFTSEKKSLNFEISSKGDYIF